MKNISLPLCVIAICVFGLSCNSDKKEEIPNEFFPVLSFIKSQVAHVDSSLYSIRKLVYIDSTRTDTIYFPREQFRQLAAEFLSVPDLSSSKYTNRYKETRNFDESMNSVILTYEPINPANEELQRQQVLIKPDPSGDKVTSIIIDCFISNKDSSVEKKMLWQVDKSFQVVAMRQLRAQPEVTTRYKVIWNEDDEQ